MYLSIYICNVCTYICGDAIIHKILYQIAHYCTSVIYLYKVDIFIIKIHKIGTEALVNEKIDI